MQRSVLFLALFARDLTIHARTLPNSTIFARSRWDKDLVSPPSDSSWSKESIFALLGVCVTFICCLIGLACSRLHKYCIWLRRGGTHLTRFLLMCAIANLNTKAIAEKYSYRTRGTISLQAQHIQKWRRFDRDEVRQEQQKTYTALLESRRMVY
jgi:hypothetical protein